MAHAVTAKTLSLQLAELGQKADPAVDKITVDGKPIATPETLTYIALYKPRNVLPTVEDEPGDDRCNWIFDLHCPLQAYAEG